MKKLVSVLVALMLCLTAVAAAESVASKTTDDLINIGASTGNATADSTLTVTTKDVPAEHKDACNKEIEKMKASASIAAYFGEVKNTAGEVVSLTKMLDTDTLNVFEITPLIVKDYKEEYGNVTAKMEFATPYTAGQPVLVMIGLITAAEDGTQTVAWTVLEGTVVEDGVVEVVLDPTIMNAIQSGTAIMSVVSK